MKPVAVALKRSGVVPDRVLRLPEVCTMVGLSRTTVFEMCSKKAFPDRIRLSAHNVGWRLSDVMAWLESRERVTA